MSYLSLEEVEDAIRPTGFSKQDYFNKHPTERFEQLLEELEKDSRAVINNQIMGEGLEYEEDKVEVLEAPSKNKIQLAFPVQDVKKVEIRNGEDYRDFSDRRYRFDRQYLILRGTVRDAGRSANHGRHLRGSKNPLKRESNKSEWRDVARQIRVTYDRGFQEIPNDVKQIQKGIIRKMLTQLRQDQNLANIEPDDVAGIQNNRQLLTEDIKERIGGVTQAREKYTML